MVVKQITVKPVISPSYGIHGGFLNSLNHLISPKYFPLTWQPIYQEAHKYLQYAVYKTTKVSIKFPIFKEFNIQEFLSQEKLFFTNSVRVYCLNSILFP